MSITEETLSQEFNRLVEEYRSAPVGSNGAEAWNLIADFSVANSTTISAALEAAMSSAPTPPAVDASLIGLSIATKYAVGGPGVRLAADIRDAILSVLAPTPPATAVSEGWVLVPREPTSGMMEAYKHAFVSHDRFDMTKVWASMLAAAPVPAREAVEVKPLGQADKDAVDYALRYGGMCRDCADTRLDGICDHSGMPCDPVVCRKVIAQALVAWRYGIKHGFVHNPLALRTEEEG